MPLLLFMEWTTYYAFEWVVVLPTRFFFFVGISLTAAFCVIFQSLQPDKLCEIRESFKVHSTFSAPQASE